MDLARKIGLNVSKSELINFGGHELFVVERFDRKGVGILLERVHQEDFCQALGVGVDQKYQDKGGPGYKDCFSIAEQYISDDIVNIKMRFTEAMLFNLIIGNNDAHGKNFSITHVGNGSIKMAPLYDLVSTEVYPNLAMKTAMSTGKTFKVEKIGSHSFREFPKDMKVSLSFVVDAAEDLLCQVKDNIESVIHSHQTKNGECEIYDKLQGIIAKNSQILTTNLEIDLDSRLGIR